MTRHPDPLGGRTSRPHRRLRLSLLALLTMAALLRLWYAFDLPLSGDEVGVGVLQASGQATTYSHHLADGIVPLRMVQGFIQYNPAFSPSDVFRSLRVAGMHPPLYYLILHYVMRFFGNDALTLRTFSIALSLASVIALYYLGRLLHGRTVGLAAAALLAVAPYGVIYGSLVRPYALAMLLALLSTALVVRLGRDSALSLREPAVVLYLTLSILGAYTVYQFAFVLALQFMYLALALRHDRRTFIGLATHAGVIAVSYLPWISSFSGHLSDITSHQYYFHRDFDFWRLGRALLVQNFPVFFSAQPALTTVAIGLPFYAALLLGLIALGRDRATRPFVAALAAYLGTYLGLEHFLRMSSLQEPRFLFFIIPISFAVASCGVIGACRNTTRRAAILLGAVALTVASSVLTCAYRHDSNRNAEERYVTDFAPTLNSEREPTLLLLNTRQRRYLFPLAHALNGSGDVYILRNVGSTLHVPDEPALNRYRRLYAANLYVDYEPDTFLSDAALDALKHALRSRNFHVSRSLTSGTGAYRHSLLVFSNEAPDGAAGTGPRGR